MRGWMGQDTQPGENHHYVGGPLRDSTVIIIHLVLQQAAAHHEKTSRDTLSRQTHSRDTLSRYTLETHSRDTATRETDTLETDALSRYTLKSVSRECISLFSEWLCVYAPSIKPLSKCRLINAGTSPGLQAHTACRIASPYWTPPPYILSPAAFRASWHLNQSLWMRRLLRLDLSTPISGR